MHDDLLIDRLQEHMLFVPEQEEPLTIETPGQKITAARWRSEVINATDTIANAYGLKPRVTYRRTFMLIELLPDDDGITYRLEVLDENTKEALRGK